MTEDIKDNIITIIKNIPKGYVTSYGRIASMAGIPRSARYIVYILKTETSHHNLPWHRVVNSRLQIAIKNPIGQNEQMQLLRSEGIPVDQEGKITKEYLWMPY